MVYILQYHVTPTKSFVGEHKCDVQQYMFWHVVTVLKECDKEFVGGEWKLLFF